MLRVAQYRKCSVYCVRQQDRPHDLWLPFPVHASAHTHAHHRSGHASLLLVRCFREKAPSAPQHHSSSWRFCGLHCLEQPELATQYRGVLPGTTAPAVSGQSHLASVHSSALPVGAVLAVEPCSAVTRL